MLLQRPTMFREGRESLFVFRRTSEAFSCRTLGARSCRHGRETPKGEDARAVADDAVGIETDDVRVASIAPRAISRLCRFVVCGAAANPITAFFIIFLCAFISIFSVPP